MQNLTTPELLAATQTLTQRERELTLAVIEHLREVQRRRAFVDAGYSSLWDYVTQGLRYSDGAAKRRIDALFALRENPELEAPVREGTLTLSALSQVQSFARKQRLRQPERAALFGSMQGKSTRQVERELATLAPEATLQRQRAVSESHTELRFAVSAELLEKLKRLQGLCAHKLKDAGSYAELLEMLADLGLEQLDPARDRRASAPKLRGTPKLANEGTRHIPAALRRQVWREAHGRCTHQREGVRCPSRFALQVDHIQPYALGGSSTDARNLRLLCRQHNLRRALKPLARDCARPAALHPARAWRRP